MIDTELLKEKVLDLAMRGKLVEQDPTEGNAKQLLEEIRLERERLIKEKKIKKSKPLPEISEDEIPYDIPESWEWVRLGDILIEHVGGGTPSKKVPEYWGGDIPWCSIKDFHGDILSKTIDAITEEGLNNSSSNLIQSGNLIVATRLAVGKIMLTDIDVAINQDLRALIFGTGVNKAYIRYIYGQLNFVTQGVTVKGININNLLSILIPLPPLKEQERIADRIDHIFKLIDHLADQQDKFINYQKLVQDKALELAMQGKLVPQIPEEGTAANLLEEVEVERQRLIDEKKIRKTKPLPEISEDEIPYDIPESWEWTWLGKIAFWEAGATPLKSNNEYYDNGEISWVLTGDLNDGFLEEVPNKITYLAVEETNVKMKPEGSVLLAMYGATIGKTAILNFPATTNQACIAAIPYIGVDNIFLQYMLKNLKEYFISIGAGGAQPNISKTKIVSTLVPLPPTKEQQRIVNKLDEINQVLHGEH